MQSRVSTVFFSVGLAILIGWIITIGKDIILPIVTAVIMVQIIYTATEGVRLVPGLARTPVWMRGTLALFGFLLMLYALTRTLVASLENLVPSLPQYQQNLQNLFNAWLAPAPVPAVSDDGGAMDSAGAMIDRGQDLIAETLTDVSASFFSTIDIAGVFQSILSSLGSFGGFIFITIFYVAFMLGELSGFSAKLKGAMESEKSAGEALDVIGRINRDIGNYLSTKTLINFILGVICWIILALFNVEYAILWAIIIGVLNYIPYIGSIIGVAFPALFAVAQFGALTIPLVITGLMVAAQVIVGNVLEPRMIGKSVNLSPLAVLIALSVWGTLWGVAGAILAVPFTTIMMIILAERKGTRPIAVMLTNDGKL